MFDIGFSELLIIAVVALIVIGPERLPKVARTVGHLVGRMQRYVNDVKADRTVGHLVGRMQRYVNDVKADISREMELDELKKLRSSMEETARSFEQSVQKEIRETESELGSVAESARPEPETEPAPAAEKKPSTEGERLAENGSSQLDLGLDTAADVSTRKPA